MCASNARPMEQCDSGPPQSLPKIDRRSKPRAGGTGRKFA